LENSIVAGAAKAGLIGVTVDWLRRGEGEILRKGVDLPPAPPAGERSGSGGTFPPSVAERVSGGRHSPSSHSEREAFPDWAFQGARRLAESEQAGVKPSVLLALVDALEEEWRAAGFNEKRIARVAGAIRTDLRERHRLNPPGDQARA